MGSAKNYGRSLTRDTEEENEKERRAHAIRGMGASKL